MKLTKIILYSDAIGHGKKPEGYEEVSQRLTIMHDGHIWFTGYDYGDGLHSRKIIRRKRVNIGHDRAENILELLRQFFFENSFKPSSTNHDWWSIVLIDDEGKEYSFNVSGVGDVILKEIDITQFMKNIIPIENMFLFDHKDSHNLP